MFKQLILVALLAAIIYSCEDNLKDCQICQTVEAFQCGTCEYNHELYQLNLGQCFQKNPHCTKHTLQDNEVNCKTCFHTHEKPCCIRGICYPIIDSCCMYDLEKRCIRCNTGFFLSLTRKTCVLPMQYCLIYNDDGTCNECIRGFIVSQLKPGICTKQVTDCTKHNDQDKCTECVTGKTASMTGNKCVTNIQGCEIYNDSEQCSQCKSTHEASKKTVGTCHLKIAHCTQYNDYYKCTSCESTHEVSQKTAGGACFLKIAECTKYDAQDKCTACKSGKAPNPYGDKCAINGIDKCKTGKDSYKCSDCETGYTLSTTENICVANVAYCEEYSDTACTKCKPTHILKDNACRAKYDNTSFYSVISFSIAVVLVLLALVF